VRISLFDRKELVSMNHSRLFAILFFILFASFQSGPAQAQVLQSYSFVGIPFDVATCQAAYPSPPPACGSGPVTGSVILNMPSLGYSGTVSEPGILSFSFAAAGVGSVPPSGVFNGNEINHYDLTNGSIVTWDTDVYTQPPSTYPWTNIHATNLGSTESDYANATDGSGAYTAEGWSSDYTLSGSWTNGNGLGPSCAADAPSDAPPLSGKVSCGEPFDVGSGNMYLSVPDYATVGQNPLSFTRYYNSMAMTDTYAVALGANWRHSFDRYLHIVNPSAVYGAIAERETGQYISFSSSSGTYTTDPDIDYSLARSGSGPAWTWTLHDPDDTVETYTQSGAEATLQSITLRNGYKQTMHYTSGKLSSVSDTYGRTLGMSY
jgi:hypothetical protein